MHRTKRPRIPDEELSPQDLEKRKKNTEAQRRRRLREQEKSNQTYGRYAESQPEDTFKQVSDKGLPILNNGLPIGLRAVTPRDNVSASELNVAVVEPGTTETETQFGPNLDIECSISQRLTGTSADDLYQRISNHTKAISKDYSELLAIQKVVDKYIKDTRIGLQRIMNHSQSQYEAQADTPRKSQDAPSTHQNLAQ